MPPRSSLPERRRALARVRYRRGAPGLAITTMAEDAHVEPSITGVGAPMETCPIHGANFLGVQAAQYRLPRSAYSSTLGSDGGLWFTKV